MIRFLMAAIAYFLLAVGVVMLTRENGIATLVASWQGTLELAPVFGRIAGILALLGVIITILVRGRSMGAMIAAVVMAFIATLFFQSGFMLIKTSLPYVTPFHADVALAEWDNVLHGGHDPWVWTHAVAGYLPMEWLTPIYLHVWVFPAICLPVIMAAIDVDKGRVMRTMILYGIAWVLIGNIIALAGLSAGPVFYDRIYGGERFADLTAAMAATPEISSYFELIQDDLWMAYTTSEQAIGSGISAFPSVHVSVAMVGALYLWERSRLLGVIGAAFVAVILFLSVYSGYHYALDGYFSIAVIWGVWAFMSRRAAKEHAVPMPDGELA